MIRRREKKTTHLEIRISQSRKDEFMRACEENCTTASDAVRAFVDAYIERSRQVKLKKLAREITMTLIRNPVRTFAGTGVFAASGLVAAFLFAGSAATAAEYVQPLNHPTNIVYPAELARAGVEGNCDVYFSVDTEGLVEPGARAECDHQDFARTAENAVYSLRFEPRLENGVPVRMENLVYPFSFSMD